MKVAVVAHAGKTLGGGLPELRRVARRRGRRGPAVVRGAEEQEGAARRSSARWRRAPSSIFAWGGDGMVRRCVGVLAGTRRVASRSSRPGTANLFATNLGIAHDIEEAVRGRAARRAPPARRRALQRRALRGDGRRRLRRGDDPRRRRPQGPPRPRRLRAQRRRATCAPRPSRRRSRSTASSWYDGPRELHPGRQRRRAVRRHRGLPRRAARRRPARARRRHRGGPGAAGRARSRAPPSATPQKSPFVRATKARKVKVKLDRKVRYELDGGDRSKVKSFKVEVEPGAMTVCVPRAERERRRDDDDRHRARGCRAVREAQRQGEQARAHAASRVAGARGPRRARGRLRDHRRPRAQARARGRRQGDQPAGRAARRSPTSRSARCCCRSSRSGSPATRCGGCVRAAIGHGPEQRDSGSDRVAGAGQRHRLRDPLRDGGRDPQPAPSSSGSGTPKKATGGVLGLARRPGARRRRGRGPDRRRGLPGLQGPQARSSSTTPRPSR